MYVSLHGFDVHYTCMQELKEARRGYQIPWGQTIGSLKLPRGCGDLDLSHLQEWQVLSTMSITPANNKHFK